MGSVALVDALGFAGVLALFLDAPVLLAFLGGMLAVLNALPTMRCEKQNEKSRGERGKLMSLVDDDEMSR